MVTTTRTAQPDFPEGGATTAFAHGLSRSLATETSLGRLAPPAPAAVAGGATVTPDHYAERQVSQAEEGRRPAEFVGGGTIGVAGRGQGGSRCVGAGG